MNIEHEQLVQTLAQRLTANAKMLSTAESCTGGWVAHCCTSVAGSSQWFERGFVTYSDEAKQDMLGVSNDCLENFGAVSKETAIAMAEGALLRSDTHCSVAITGIAGPDGGSDEKPVGSVWFAWGQVNVQTVTAYHCFSGDRASIRSQAVSVALQGILPE